MPRESNSFPAPLMHKMQQRLGLRLITHCHHAWMKMMPYSYSTRTKCPGKIFLPTETLTRSTGSCQKLALSSVLLSKDVSGWQSNSTLLPGFYSKRWRLPELMDSVAFKHALVK